MGSKQEYDVWLQVQGSDPVGLRDMCRGGSCHCSAAVEGHGLLVWTGWKAKRGSWPLCKSTAGVHGLCLGMGDELRVYRSGLVGRPTGVTWSCGGLL